MGRLALEVERAAGIIGAAKLRREAQWQPADEQSLSVEIAIVGLS